MKLTCAVVGLGRIGSTLEKDTLREKPCTHTGAIIADTRCELIAAADTDPKARDLFSHDWSAYADFRMYDSAASLLAAHVPDILVISTPPDSHLRIAARAAASGVPVVICEKPLAPSLRQAKAIAHIHVTRNTRIIVNHERRYSADYRQVKECVDDERYGRLLSVNGTLYFGRTARHRDVLLHDGTHMVDSINFLTGSRCRLRRRYGSMRSSRSSACLFGRAGTIPVIIDVGAERDHLVFELQLSFEMGRIRIGNGVFQFERSEPSPYYERYRSLLPEKICPPVKTGYFANMLSDAVDCAQDPTRQPVSSAVDGLEVMRFIRSLGALV